MIPQKVRQIFASTLLLGLAGAAAALFFFAWLTEEMLEGETVRFDASVRDFVHGLASPALTGLMRFVTALGSPAFLIPAAALAILLFRRAGRHNAALLFAIAVAGAAILDEILKLSFRRIRPEPFFNTPLPYSYSFPSGHAMVSCCFWGALAAILAAREPRRYAKAALWIAAALMSGAIGYSRIYLGVHYPSDVLAGYAAAVVWVLAVDSAYRMLRRRNA